MIKCPVNCGFTAGCIRCNEIQKEGCIHEFKYSHQETTRISPEGLNYVLVDVVVCSRCGLIKRN